MHHLSDLISNGFELRIKEDTLPEGLNAITVEQKNLIGIIINRNTTQAQKRCALVEELEHVELKHFGNFLKHPETYSEVIRMAKQEAEAKTRAAEIVIKVEDLVPYLNPYADTPPINEIADSLQVTPELLRIKLKRLFQQKEFREVLAGV